MTGAEGGTRTPTRFLSQPPQGCVSTNSTTPAKILLTVDDYHSKIKIFRKQNHPFYTMGKFNQQLVARHNVG